MAKYIPFTKFCAHMNAEKPQNMNGVVESLTIEQLRESEWKFSFYIGIEHFFFYIEPKDKYPTWFKNGIKIELRQLSYDILRLYKC